LLKAELVTKNLKAQAAQDKLKSMAAVLKGRKLGEA